MLLFSADFSKELASAISGSQQEIFICSAFIKERAMKALLENLPDQVSLTVVARWAKHDLLFGASDLGVYRWCENNGHRFGVNSNLHAKLYLVDQSFIFLGSANLTHRGLSFAGAGNIEIGTRLDPSVTDIEKFKSFLDNEVVWVNDGLYKLMEKEIIAENAASAEKKDTRWSVNINEMLDRKVSHLWVSELVFNSPSSLQSPNFESPEIVHDFELLDLTIDGFGEDCLKQGFFKTRLYLWLRDTIGVENEVRFGWVTNQLHNALIDEVTPYRSEVKEFTKILFDWFKFAPEVFDVKRFNVSETVLIKC
jgi:hypothetical protein